MQQKRSNTLFYAGHRQLVIDVSIKMTMHKNIPVSRNANNPSTLVLNELFFHCVLAVYG